MTTTRWLTVWLFAMLVVSALWAGTLTVIPLAWGVAAAVALAAHFLARPEAPQPSRWRKPGASDLLLAAVAFAPTLVDLASTWNQEFPYNGDQALHQGHGLQAFAFWVSWPGLLAAAAIAFVVWHHLRHERSKAALIGIVAFPIIGILCAAPLSFAGRYPGTLHFAAVPFAAVGFGNAERLLNALAIPAWLLLLRPMLIGRPAGAGTATAALLLFWQKDVVYYFSSHYLEPWALVLVLTAAEHLLLFDDEQLWRPLLLLGTAAMIKEQMVITLPIVALLYFPRQWLTALVSLTPFLVFLRLRQTFKTWGGTAPSGDAFSRTHWMAYFDRVSIQFGPALPVIAVGLLALAVFARRRPFRVLLLAALADMAFFYFAAAQQPWAGYPRTNLVPLAYAALGLGALVERAPAKLLITALVTTLVAILNAIPLAGMLRSGWRKDTARNFFEHGDAPIFYPIREGIELGEAQHLIDARSEIHLLHNGKQLFPRFYPGPMEDQYPDLARSHRLRVMSFQGNPARCRCGADGAVSLALFIRFENLGERIPQRGPIEAEAARCRAEMEASCARRVPLYHEGDLVALLGAR